jgi:protoporphyrinogen oxidase
MLRRSDVLPLVFEADSQVGGISKTIVHCGNRMDLGGHRFFSKSDWVMKWWQELLPIAAAEMSAAAEKQIELAYHGRRTTLNSVDVGTSDPDRVMLVRSRLSRIFYRRRFFDYPLKLNAATLGNLGAAYTAQIGASYVRARIAPRNPERSLEDFLINRFGDKLYRTFFKDYTEKVWGVPCSEISAEWGAQRIKGLSVSKAVWNAVAKPFRAAGDTRQKNTETSLIERFLYPKLGPGQMWEEAARRVISSGGSVHVGQEVVALHTRDGRVEAVDVRDLQSGETRRQACDYLVSTMPVKRLVGLLGPTDTEVHRIASALPYRDFMTAGLLVRRMRPSSGVSSPNGMPPDNWIYVQEPDVKLGRLQIFNNWSPYLVSDPETIWLGLEYFCAEGDELWSMRDDTFLSFAARELAKIGLIDLADVMDGTVVRVPKAYPAYFGEYRGIGRVRAWLDGWSNVFAVGRNGMHRYNNQDHSMLAAKAAVDCILDGRTDKSAIWSVNAEDEYHEVASTPSPGSATTPANDAA